MPEHNYHVPKFLLFQGIVWINALRIDRLTNLINVMKRLNIQVEAKSEFNHVVQNMLTFIAPNVPTSVNLCCTLDHSKITLHLLGEKLLYKWYINSDFNL